MAITREQTQMPKSLTALSDDAARHALSFLSVAECRRSVGASSKHFRALATSTALARTRFSDHYVLRGDRQGVVHFLATAGGTREWPTRYYADVGPSYLAAYYRKLVPAPPPALRITARRRKAGEQDLVDANAQAFEAAVVFPSNPCPSYLDARGYECGMQGGCFVDYRLPFELRISHFRIGFGNCFASHFRDWVFEAFDGQLANWRVLYDSDGVSPWPLPAGGWGAHTMFPVEPSFPSSRFRIRLTNVTHGLGHQCMHIRGFELFGAILPPWRIDA